MEESPSKPNQSEGMEQLPGENEAETLKQPGPEGNANVVAIETGPPMGAGRLALQDLTQGFFNWQIWFMLGWRDIKKRYRRSVIGPFWLTISMAVTITALGLLYGLLLGLRDVEFLPFLTLGFLAWALIAGVVNDGCQAFIGAENFIKQIKIPYSTFVYQIVWRNLIIFAHNSVVFVGVALIYGIWPGINGLLIIPGLLIISLNGIWIALLLGLLSARYRDVNQLVGSIIQVFFFLTPIIWQPQMLKDKMVYLNGNPFFHFVELIRAPLLGHAPTAANWGISIGLLVVGSLGTFFFYRRYRSRIAIWL